MFNKAYFVQYGQFQSEYFDNPNLFGVLSNRKLYIYP